MQTLTRSINIIMIYSFILFILLLHITMHSDAGFLPKQVYIFYMDQLTIKVCHSIIFKIFKQMHGVHVQVVHCLSFQISYQKEWIMVVVNSDMYVHTFTYTDKFHLLALASRIS